MDTSLTYYLAGPMTGYPQFNFPLFSGVAEKLRSYGFSIIAPSELDSPEVKKAALASTNGDHEACQVETWGQLLGRDIQILADDCKGIIFLPDWQESKGARLEATCAVNLGYKCFAYSDNELRSLTHGYVLTQGKKYSYEDQGW